MTTIRTALLTLLGAAVHATCADPALKWDKTPTSLALLRDGRTLWRHCHDPKEPKPYFHPLALPDGTELTCLKPADHVWHLALWWSWKYINGLLYWEPDKKTGLSPGATEIADVKTAPNSDGSARIEMDLVYQPRNAPPPVLREKRVLAMSAPDAAGSYCIDWTSTFTAGDKDATLDRTPIPGQPGGVPHGGYAGLSIRCAPTMKDWVFLNSEGATGQNDTRSKPARWMDFSGKAGGIAILDHPKNLRHPSPWYPIQNMPYFSPAVLYHAPYTLPAGKNLTLRYCILVHAAAMDRGALDKQWDHFSKQQPIR